MRNNENGNSRSGRRAATVGVGRARAVRCLGVWGGGRSRRRGAEFLGREARRLSCRMCRFCRAAICIAAFSAATGAATRRRWTLCAVRKSRCSLSTVKKTTMCRHSCKAFFTTPARQRKNVLSCPALCTREAITPRRRFIKKPLPNLWNNTQGRKYENGF